MTSRSINDKNLLSGTIFIVLGSAWIFTARSYSLGSATHMGPAYFPDLVAGVLILLGLVNIWRGWRSVAPKPLSPLAWRPLGALFAGVVLFSLLIDREGLLVAIAVLVGCCCVAGPRFRLWEVAAILGTLMAIAALLFVYGLDLPFAYLLPH